MIWADALFFKQLISLSFLRASALSFLVGGFNELKMILGIRALFLKTRISLIITNLISVLIRVNQRSKNSSPAWGEVARSDGGGGARPETLYTRPRRSRGTASNLEGEF